MTSVALLFVLGTFGQETTSAIAPPMREVRGQMVISQELPKADFTFGRRLRFIGSQRVNLYGNAEAEQYLFAEVGPGGVVDRFCWLQFEHFLPTHNGTYDYAPKRTTEIGGLRFIYNVNTWPDYAALLTEDPASDGAAIGRLLKQHRLSLPDKAVHVRMFHLPSADHRTELMIIYGEALRRYPKVPVRQGGVELDTESPSSAQMFLDHVRKTLRVRSR
jgi:hypothetical protein